MHLVDEKLPNEGDVIIAYTSENSHYFSKYKKVLTWNGYKLKFVNLMSHGMWFDNVVGWNNIPVREETF